MVQTYLDVQHFDILFPNVVLAALLNRLRNVYRCATSSNLRGVNDSVEWTTARALGYLQQFPLLLVANRMFLRNP